MSEYFVQVLYDEKSGDGKSFEADKEERKAPCKIFTDMCWSKSKCFCSDLYITCYLTFASFMSIVFSSHIENMHKLHPYVSKIEVACLTYIREIHM